MSALIDLHDLIMPEVEALGLDLVRLAWVNEEGQDPSLQIMAERPETRQLIVEDCALLSRRISKKFDAMEEEGNDPIAYAYRLEVSSPGIDRPLTRLSDYKDWQGHEAKIELDEKLDGQKRFRGELRGVDRIEDDVFILISDRKDMDKTYRLPAAMIADAKLVLTDKLIAATVPLQMDGAEEIENSYDSDIDKEEQD